MERIDNAAEALDNQAEEALQAVGIPPCPAVLTDLLREMRADEPDFNRVGKLITGDVALSATMLRTVNSPFYGLRRPATSVSEALRMLGLRTVAELVRRLLLRQSFPAGANMEKFWESSSRIAELSAHIAQALKAVDAETAHTFGLFRDCGMAVLACRHADYTRLTPQAERERYGVDHAQIGFKLARSWLLPEALCLALRYHHDDDALQGRHRSLPVGSMRLAAVAALAELAYLAARGEAPGQEQQAVGAFAAAQLGVGDEAQRAFAAHAGADSAGT